MKLYRVVHDEKKLLNEKFLGHNSFEYEKGVDYIHFFLLPENAISFQRVMYYNQGLDSRVLQCDIPYEIIKDNFGVGLYGWYLEDKRTPFLECRIKAKDFKKKYIKKVEYEVDPAWENKDIYYRFLKSCVDNTDPIERLNGIKIILNKDFKYEDYFPKEDLEKEGIDTSNYPKPITFDDIDYFKMFWNYETPKKRRLEQFKEKIKNFYQKTKTKKRW